MVWSVEHVENPATQQEVIIRLHEQKTIEAKALIVNNANLSFETRVMILEGKYNCYLKIRVLQRELGIKEEIFYLDSLALLIKLSYIDANVKTCKARY